MMRRVFVLLCVIAATACHRESRVDSFSNPPVIVVSIDTLRADHLPMFGYRGVETPQLDAFRADAVLFRNAYSHVPLTLPSHVSILTGLLPPDHKVRNNIGYLLDPKIATLPRFLKGKGYETGAAVSAYVLHGSSGLSSAFDFYEDGVSQKSNTAVGSLARSGRKTAELALQWIGPRSEKPFFFLFHIFEPHSPYAPEEVFRAKYRDAYDGEIATADSIVGSFFDELKRTGVYDKAIIVVLSDHGEGLNDHGEPEHGIFVYREAIHVPLLVKLPKSARRGQTVDAPVGLVDVFPTVAKLVGAEIPPGLAGRSLFDAPDAQRRIYSESIYGRIHLGWSELRSLAGERFHFIQAPRPELYDMTADPHEKTNVLSTERRTYASMRDELGTRGAAVEGPANIDPEEAKKLAALGYLSSTAAATGPLPDPKDRIGEITMMIQATELLAQNKPDEAATQFRAILARNPLLADAWIQLGTSLEQGGRLEEAADVYKRAIEAAPALASQLALRRGSVLLRLERYDEAEQHARLGEKTNEAAMHLLLSRIALAKKDFPRAQQEATEAAKDRGSRIAADILLAQALAQQNLLPQANEALQRAESINTSEGGGPVEQLEFVRGDILARMERYPDAIAAFRKEIAQFPHNRQTYANLYLVLMVTNRPAEAQGALEEMVKANPNRSAYLFAAHTVEALGDAQGAAAWKRRAK